MADNEMNMDFKLRPKPLVLLILDGWGVAPPSDGNAISVAKTPNFDNLISSYPTMTLLASGESVGKAWGSSGSCDYGHRTIGTGEIIYDNLSYINKLIKEGEFVKNKIIVQALSYLKENNRALHLFGLYSDSNRCTEKEHLYSLLELAKSSNLKKVYLHVFLDGKDVPKDNGIKDINKLEKKLKEIGIGEILTISGIQYAMDNNHNWENTKQAYNAIINSETEYVFKSTDELFETFYSQKIYDENINPSLILNKDNKVQPGDNDIMICFNFAPNESSQLIKAITLPAFQKFERKIYLQNLDLITFFPVEKDIPNLVAFQEKRAENNLTDIFTSAGLNCFRISETIKYPQTYFYFNGEKVIINENQDAYYVSSVKTDNYSSTPEMKTNEIAERLIKEINSDNYDFILCNFGASDIVALSGDLTPTVKSIEIIDKSLNKIISSVLAKNGILILTSDHGNVENMLDMQTENLFKGNTSNPVPFIIIGNNYDGKSAQNEQLISNDLSLLNPSGSLIDIAPTILSLLHIEVPASMKGKDLLKNL